MDQQQEKQLLQLLSSLDKALKSSSGLHNLSQSSKSTSNQSADSKSQQRYENQLNSASKSFAELVKRQKTLAKLESKKAEFTDKELSESVKGRKIQASYNKALADVAADLQENGRESTLLNLKTREYQKLVNRELHEQESAIRHQIAGMNTLSTALGKAQRQSSLLTASLIESTGNFREGSAEYSAWIAELGESTKGLDVLGKSFLKSAGIVDNITGEMRENISASDFAGLRLRLGEAQETISESFAGLEHIGVGGLQDAVNKITAIGKKNAAAGYDDSRTPEENTELKILKEHLRETAEKLVKANISMGNFAHMFDENGKMTDTAFNDLETNANDLGAHLENVASSAAKVTEHQDALGRSAHTAAGKIEGFARALKADPTGFMMDTLKGKLGTTAAILGGLNKASDGIKRSWEDIKSFNIAQVPATFLDVQAASIKMGMSFEETVKFMQENKRMLGIYGAEGFGKLMGQTKDVFSKFGYNMKQAGEIVGPAIEAGISSGINVRSGEALNKFIDQSMDSFKNISGITNITAKEYMALNAELLNSQDVASSMIGMDQARAQEYAKDTIAARNHHVAMGLSAQMANEVIKAQQQQQRSKVADKAVNAAKGMAMAQQLGMSGEESQRYYQLAMKKRSAAEETEFGNIVGKMGVLAEQKEQDAQDKYGTGGYLSQQLATQALMPADVSKLLEAGIEKEKASRARTAMTDEKARSAGEAAAGSEAVADIGNVTNTISSILTNSFSVALIGAATSAVGFALQLRKASGLIGGLGGGGLGGGPGGGPGGRGGGPGGGKWGKMINAGKGLMSGAGSILGKVAAPLAAGYLAMSSIGDWNSASKEEEAGTITKEEASKKKGGAVGTAIGGIGGALAGAKAGALLGSFIPGAGTLIGGLLGGVVGAAGSYLASEAGGSIGESIGGWLGSSDEKKPLATSEVTKDVTQVAQVKDKETESTETVGGNVALIASLDKLTAAILSTAPTFMTSSQVPQDNKMQTSTITNAVASFGGMLMPGLGTITALGSSMIDMFGANTMIGKQDVSKKPENNTFDTNAFNIFSGKNLIDAMLGQATADIVAPTDNVAVPSVLNAPKIVQPGSQVSAEEVNNKSEKSQTGQSSDAPMPVSDAAANTHLTAIAESLISAVALLQQMADAKDTTSPSTERRQPLVTQPIPTSYAYVTGRV